MRLPAATRKQTLALIVDDDPMMRLMLRETLQREGIAVLEAQGGADALVRFKKDSPDVVLLDVMMKGLDGFETCAALRHLSKGSRTPVVMLTSLDDVESINKAYEAGATDFLIKPINWTILGHHIRYILRASAALNDLAASQASLAKSQRVAQLGSWEWDVGNQQFYYSSEMYRVLGKTAKVVDPTIDLFLETVHPDDRPLVRSTMSDTIEAHKPHDFTFRVVRPDGAIAILRSQAQLEYEEEGKVIRVNGIVQDVTERERSEERIRYLAYFDSLTDLPNRIWFREQLEHAVANASRHSRIMGMMLLDMDQFKRINDTMGHRAGDQLVRAVAQRVVECIRSEDWLARMALPDTNESIARIGGDEFSILLTDLQRAEDAAKVAERLLWALEQPFDIDGIEVFTSASIGVAIYPIDGATADELLKAADTAMFCAKDEGRNNFQFYSSGMNAKALEKIMLEGALHKAIERKEFVIHYQPQVDITTGRVIGLEALIRWQHPEQGLVMPNVFIPIAEESRLITAISELMLRSVCGQNKTWQTAGLKPLCVSVNLSGHDFRKAGLCDLIKDVLQENELETRYLKLELTEGVLMEDVETTLANLHQLKQMGISLSIDDFGTGYSSMSYLKRFPLDDLKIDQSFIMDITDNPDDAAIAAAIISMARHLGLSVVAEGIETQQQLAFLRKQGCPSAQGYLFSRPLPFELITPMLAIDFAFTIPQADPD